MAQSSISALWVLGEQREEADVEGTSKLFFSVTTTGSWKQATKMPTPLC